MSQHKETYTIDFTDVKNFLEMHFVIKEALDFPDYYGCNWSALWDSLTDMYGITAIGSLYFLPIRALASLS